MSTLSVNTIQSNTSGSPPTIADSNGTQIGTLCRAWVNFNGVTTIAVRASFNVSSVVRNGTGDYTINFTNALPDTSFVTNVSVRRESAFNNPPSVAVDQYLAVSRPNTTTSTSVMCGDQTATRDSSVVAVSVFR